MIAGFVANDGQDFKTVLKFDKESLSNEERYEILQKKELIYEFLKGGIQSIEDDLKMKEENKMCKYISIGNNHNCILMKERVKESPRTVMKFEEEEY